MSVALVQSQGYSVPEAAKSVGISDKLLYNWKKQVEDKQSAKALSDDEREELKRLRKENKKVLMLPAIKLQPL